MPSDLKLAGLDPKGLEAAAVALRKMYHGENAEDEPFHLMCKIAISAYLGALPAPTELSHEAQSRDEVVELREALGRVIVEAEAIGPVPTHDTYGDRRRLMLGMVKMQHEAREALSKSEQNP